MSMSSLVLTIKLLAQNLVTYLIVILYHSLLLQLSNADDRVGS